MQKKIYTTELAGKELVAEFSDLTEQANGSVLLKYDETALLVTAVMKEEKSDHAFFFPLSVEFEEKFYASGQILGSRFQRREGRPSEEAILSARVIDRTIRPLFDQRIRHDIQIVVTVLALGNADPDVLGVIGTSLALSVSDIPWNGPVGAVRVGKSSVDGSLTVQPTYAERADELATAEVLACGKEGTINMIETAANEVAEATVLEMIETAVSTHQQLETWQQSIVSEIGKQKRDLELPEVLPEIVALYQSDYAEKLYAAVFSNRAGKDHITAVKKEFLTELKSREIATDTADHFFEEQIDNTLHQGALTDGLRADGRGFDDVRSLYAQAGNVSPVLHGSGIFYRGGTHIFSALTLGGPESAQTIDTIETHDHKKRFLHHYNFPPFSVGDTGRVGGFNRRMIGHGALAEKALMPVIPDQTIFPYTIRLVSETLASNGSSSMGSVCASTLAMMDGGVPIKRPVAGIASGALIDGDNFVTLTDIQGPEDEFGDMDFKVAGTTEGVTAIQMDIKVNGIPLHILEIALEKAKEARLHILETMAAEISAPRATISPRAPEIISLLIQPDQIGLVIGSGGKTITGIKEETGVEEITIEEDGTVFITGKNGTAKAAADRIAALTKIYEVGEQTKAIITRIADFGAFAKLDEYNEGLIHISEIAPFRIEKMDGVLAEGQTVPVEVIKVADGKIGLSIKKINPDFAKENGITES